MTGTMDEIKEQVDENMKAKDIEIPPKLYLMPPKPTECDCNKCESCEIQPTGGKISKIL